MDGQNNNDNKEMVTKRDLLAFVEAYSNMMQSTNVLLENQKRLQEKIKEVQEMEDEILNGSSDVLSKISDIMTIMNNNLPFIKSNQEQLSGNIKNHEEAMKNCVTNQTLDLTKQHGSLKVTVIGHYVLLGTIVLSLITFMIKSWDKLNLIVKIAESLGVGK